MSEPQGSDIANATHAIEAGRAFLEDRQSPDSLWRDFQTLAGESSDWVSGFIACVLNAACWDRPPRLQTLKALLYRQRPNGGWSYNASVPTDCDSTAWTLLALLTGPTWKPSAILRGLTYLESHQLSELGGFATYHEADGIDRFIGAEDRSLMTGWFDAHTSVTGTTLQCLLLSGFRLKDDVIQGGIRYLLKARTPHGTWPSYWWRGHSYGTYQALRALRLARAVDWSIMRPTIAYLLESQHSDGGWNDHEGTDSDVFSTAFSVLSLLLAPIQDAMAAADRGVAWLSEHQRMDGGWNATPMLRIPPPMVHDPESVTNWQLNELGTGVLIADQHRLFTSASALFAIASFCGMQRRSAKPLPDLPSQGRISKEVRRARTRCSSNPVTRTTR